jgi:hypothetical protein
MTTRAEAYRAREERSRHPPRPKKKRIRRDRPVDTAQAGVSETDRKAGKGDTGRRNRAEHIDGATVAYETSATDRPSRKSGRRSAGRKKASSTLERRRQHEAERPEVKAQRKKKAPRHAKPRRISAA